jgi:CHAT domain-containing protein
MYRHRRRLNIEPKIGRQCTRVAIESALRGGDCDIVHLAVHGRGDVRRGGRASILLATQTGDVEWIPFDSLKDIEWNVGLVTFSGCSTAVAGPRDGGHTLSVADAATETGASAVLACLWPVSDHGAQIFMTAFYKELARLRDAGCIDLRVAFNRAQIELRAATDEVLGTDSIRRNSDDSYSRKPERTVDEILLWAPFILVGDPLVRERGQSTA